MEWNKIMNNYIMKRLLLIGCMLMWSVGAMGQTNVEIAGEVVGGAGKKVILGGYSDMLTWGEVVLDSTRVGADGRFSVKCYVNYPRLVFVQIERYSESFYVEPGRRYDVYVPAFDWDVDEKRNVYLEPVALPMEFVGVDSGELNLKIMRFETAVDSFVEANRERLDFRFRRDRRAMEELERMVRMRFGGEGDSDAFFNRYVEYTMGEMRLAMGLGTRRRLVEAYVATQPIRYYDESYMRFFLALFEHAISDGTKRVSQWQMADFVERGAVDAWLDTLGLDPLLENEQVRELAALEALKEMFFSKYYNGAGVVRMTRALGERSKFEEHRALAESLVKMMERRQAMEQGHSGWLEFDLPDVERRRVRLSDFRGKWIYVGFVRTGDPNSLKEIETMAHFRDTVYAKHPDVVFVTVVCDREFQKMYHFVKNSRRGARCNWTWLHFDGDYEMLERWEVASYPTFVLIDPEGRRVYDWTPWPGEGILMHGPWEKEN